MSKRRFVISLSSGGSLGYAHIGVLKAFVETGIEISAIAGTSMGGIVASLYALGMLPHDIEHLFNSVLSSISVFSSAMLLRLGITAGPLGFLRDFLEDITVGDSKIPLYVYATDVYSQKPYLFRKEDPLFIACRATASIPIVFPPVRYKHMYLVDGGITLPLPTSNILLCKDEQTISVGIDVYGGVLKKGAKSLSVMETYSLIMSNHGKCHGQYLDFIISPDLEGYSNLMYGRVKEIVNRGYKAGIEFVEMLYKRGLI